MSNSWNIANVRRIAGLPTPAVAKLNEAWDADDSDDEDPDVKIANADKGQQHFEKKNKKELKAASAGAKEMSSKKKPDAESPKKEAAATKKEEAPAKAEVKKVEAEKTAADTPAAAEAKRRGKAPNPNSFNQHAKSKASSMKRGDFIAWAAKEHGKGKHYASSLFAKHNPKSSRQAKEANEGWIIVHPHLNGFLLAENRELNQMQWVDPSSPIDPMFFTNEAEAQKVVKYMAEWKSQAAVVEHIVFEADEAE